MCPVGREPRSCNTGAHGYILSVNGAGRRIGPFETKARICLGEDAPSALENLTAALLRTGREEAAGSSIQVSLRVPKETMAFIEALVKVSDVPRAQVINQPLEVGTEALYDTLP